MKKENRKVLYEGKAKILYKGSEPNTIIQFFKDDATAFNNKKHTIIDGKGILNNKISTYLMEKLINIGIPTHFIKSLNDNSVRFGVLPVFLVGKQFESAPNHQFLTCFC